VSVVDGLVVGLLAVGLVLGIIRGFLTQVTGIAGLVVGIVLAGRYHEPLREHGIDRLFDSGHNAEIAFGLILVTTLFLASLVGLAVRKAVEKLELGAYDRLMGGLLGACKAGLIAGGVLLTLVTFAPDGGGIERAIGSSRAAPKLWQAMNGVAHVLPSSVRGHVEGFLRANPLPEPPPEPVHLPGVDGWRGDPGFAIGDPGPNPDPAEPAPYGPQPLLPQPGPHRGTPTPPPATIPD